MEKNYRKFGVITVVAVYLLILVGGIVRSTGSGMGCPDWPKCFGEWIPPTEESQLPENYKEIFKVQGKEIADFNAFKTWTEYINRLIGVAIGLFIFITFLLSVAYLKKDKIVFYLSLAAFLLVGFQGWLGSVVVATDLKPFLITLHMLLALFIVSLLIYTVARSYQQQYSLSSQDVASFKANRWILLGIFLGLVQIVMGTQVREEVDMVAKSLGAAQRDAWIDQLGIAFYIHRSFSLVILGVHAYICLLVFKLPKSQKIHKNWAKALVAVLVLETMTGAMMAYLSIPAFLQPIHLLLATIAFGLQVVLLMQLNGNRLFAKQHIAVKEVL